MEQKKSIRTIRDHVESESQEYSSNVAQIIAACGVVLNSKNALLIALLAIVFGAGYVFKYGVDKISHDLELINHSLTVLTAEAVRKNYDHNPVNSHSTVHSTETIQ